MSAPAAFHSDASFAAVSWWRSLSGDNAARAQLRRSRSGIEVATVPAGLRLARMLGAARDSTDARFVAACELARVLAWVREDHEDSLLRRLGWPRFPDEKGDDGVRPTLSEGRFRRLLRTDDLSELADQCVRMVRQADHQCAVGQLARDMMAWTDRGRADHVKRRWAYDYFNAGFATPTQSDREEPAE